MSGLIAIDRSVPVDDVQAVLMHEFGHIVGLDHVRSQSQVMAEGHSRGVIKPVWGAGDRAGLRRVGREAGCLQPPKPS